MALHDSSFFADHQYLNFVFTCHFDYIINYINEIDTCTRKKGKTECQQNRRALSIFCNKSC